MNGDARREKVLVWSLPIEAAEAESLAEVRRPEEYQPAAKVVLATCGGSLAAFVTEESRLYLMDLRPYPEPSGSPRIVQALRDDSVEFASCGSSHVVVVVAGVLQLLSCGPSGEFAGRTLASAGGRLPLSLPERVAHVSCGGSHVLLLTEGGALFTFGAGTYGQLGLGSTQATESPTRILCLSHVRVVDVAAGEKHSCAATTFGNLFTWGDNRIGQLGDGSSLSRFSPSLIGDIQAVQKVAASSATAVLCSGGRVYATCFGGSRVLEKVFDDPCKCVALALHVVCAISNDNELLMRGMCGVRGQVLRPRGSVGSIAAAKYHVLATTLSGTCIPSSSSRQFHTTSLQASERSIVGALVPLVQTLTVTNSSDLAVESPYYRDEVVQLMSSNNRLAMSMDELTAEQFLDAGPLHAEMQVAADVAVKRLAGLTKARAYAATLKGELEVYTLCHEIEAEQNAIDAACAERERAHGELQAAEGGLLVSATVLDAPTLRDMQERQSLLQVEGEQLQHQRDALQSSVASWREELSLSGDRLKRIEDACVRTRIVVERHRVHLSEQEKRAMEVEAHLHRVSVECASVDTQCGAQLEELKLTSMSRQNNVLADVQRMRDDRAILSARLAGVNVEVDSCAIMRKELLSEISSLSQVQVFTAQYLSEQQLICESAASKVKSIRSEYRCAAETFQDIKALTARSELAARSFVAEQARRCNARRDEISALIDAQHRERNLVEVVAGLKQRIASDEASEQRLVVELHQQAARFSERIEPLQNEVQELHAAIAELSSAEKADGLNGTPRQLMVDLSERENVMVDLLACELDSTR